MILHQEAIKREKRSTKVGQLFSLANQLRQQGKNPIDLMLGNPIEKPNREFYNVLEHVVGEMRLSSTNPHKYMENNGYLETRKEVAYYMSKRTKIPFQATDILMTAGCSNGLDLTFAAILEPGAKQEVIILTPCFMGYIHYISLNQGIPVMVPLNKKYEIDYKILDQSINNKTKAIILNFPNNPTGAILEEEEQKKAGKISHSKK